MDLALPGNSRDPSSGSLQFNVPAKKKRKLNNVKCWRCRKDKKKCTPTARTWPTPCDRCRENEYECSEGQTASQIKSSGVDPNSLPLAPSAPSEPSDALSEEDLFILIEYHENITKAKDRFHTIRSEINAHLGIDEFEQEDLAYYYHDNPGEDISEPLFKWMDSLEEEVINRVKDSLLSNQQVGCRPLLLGSVKEAIIAAGPRCLLCRSDTDWTRSLSPKSLFFLSIRMFCLWESQWCPSHRKYFEKEVHNTLQLLANICLSIGSILDRLGLKFPSLYDSRHLPIFLQETDLKTLFTHDTGGLIPSIDIFGRNLLHIYLDSKYYDLPNDLFQDNNSFKATDLFGRTPLHVACQHNRGFIIERLLHAGADPSAIVSYGHKSSALHFAAVHQYTSALERLLRQERIDLNVEDFHGRTALCTATRKENHLVVDLLLRQADVNAGRKLPLFEVTMNKDTRLIQKFIDAGADIEKRDARYGSPLDFALHSRDEDFCFSVIKIMVEQKEQKGNHNDRNSTLVLFYCASRGLLEAAKYVFDRADPNARNEDSRTPLMIAAKNGYADMVEFFVSKQPKVDLWLRDKDGRNALELARERQFGYFKSTHDRIVAILEQEERKRLSGAADMLWVD